MSRANASSFALYVSGRAGCETGSDGGEGVAGCGCGGGGRDAGVAGCEEVG